MSCEQASGHCATADPDEVIAAARGWLGTPYHDQASLKGVGCDCLGLIRGVWREVVGPETFTIPPYSRDWGEIGAREIIADAARAAMIEISTDEIKPGAVVMFRMTRGVIAKHLGVMSAPDRFIHSYERLGVIEAPLTQAWARKIAFAFLLPERA